VYHHGAEACARAVSNSCPVYVSCSCVHSSGHPTYLSTLVNVVFLPAQWSNRHHPSLLFTLYRGQHKVLFPVSCNWSLHLHTSFNLTFNVHWHSGFIACMWRMQCMQCTHVQRVIGALQMHCMMLMITWSTQLFLTFFVPTWKPGIVFTFGREFKKDNESELLFFSHSLRLLFPVLHSLFYIGFRELYF